MPKLTPKPFEIGELIYVLDPEAPQFQYRGVVKSLDPVTISVWPDANIEPNYDTLDPVYVVDDYFKLENIRRIQWVDVGLTGYADALEASGQRPPKWEPKAQPTTPSNPPPRTPPHTPPATEDIPGQTSLFSGVSNAKIDATPDAPKQAPEEATKPYDGPLPKAGDQVEVLPTSDPYWCDRAGKCGVITNVITSNPPMIDLLLEGEPHPAVNLSRFKVIPVSAPSYPDVSKWIGKKVHIHDAKIESSYREVMESANEAGIQLRGFGSPIAWDRVGKIESADEVPIPGDEADAKRVKKVQDDRAMNVAGILNEIDELIQSKPNGALGKRGIEHLADRMALLRTKLVDGSGTGLEYESARADILSRITDFVSTIK